MHYMFKRVPTGQMLSNTICLVQSHLGGNSLHLHLHLSDIYLNLRFIVDAKTAGERLAELDRAKRGR